MTKKKSSRIRYEEFRRAFREGRADELAKEDYEKGNERADKSARREYLREYVRWLWPYKYAAAAIVVLALLTAGLEMASPLFMRHIVDNVLLKEGLSASEQLTRLHLIGGTFLAFVMIGQLLGALKNYRQKQLNVRVILSLRKTLYDRLLRLPLQKLSDMKTGGILSRLSGDINTTTGLLQLAIISPGVSIIRLVIAVSILFYLNWRLSLTAISIIPGIMLLSFAVARKIRPIYRGMRKDSSAVDARVSETFGGIRVVRAFRRELRETSEYLVGRHAILRKSLFAHRRELVLWTSWGFLIASVNVLIMWFGGYLALKKEASIGDIMAFQWFTFLLLNPIWQIVNSFSELQRSLAAMERVFEVLAMPEDKPDKLDASDAPSHVDTLEFDNVTFEYNEDRPVIRDFSVKVPGGHVVALVGRSGAGKTTVTDLVARFYDPTIGCVRLNGRDIRDHKLDSYRNLLAIVQQEVFLFDGTVSENIAYARSKATQAEIEDASRQANAHEFIIDLPDGYQSIIGERGVKLSGGQCQRLSIARAILADPQILILDEATSNLDTESEQLIQQSMARLLQGRTTFVIAHRLSTISSADLILVLDQGEIVERGGHEALMNARGAYYDMVVRQRDAMLNGLLQ